jgi:hypothetical protein
MLDSMPNPDTPHLRPDLTLHLPPDLNTDQIERVQKILDQVLTYLRSRTHNLPPEADLALIYDLQPEADR